MRIPPQRCQAFYLRLGDDSVLGPGQAECCIQRGAEVDIRYVNGRIYGGTAACVRPRSGAFIVCCAHLHLITGAGCQPGYRGGYGGAGVRPVGEGAGGAFPILHIVVSDGRFAGVRWCCPTDVETRRRVSDNCHGRCIRFGRRFIGICDGDGKRFAHRQRPRACATFRRDGNNIDVVARDIRRCGALHVCRILKVGCGTES